MRPQVLGRDAERAAIDRILGATRDGLSGALVLRGDAGMGKTTLLEYAAAAATELRVVRLAGVESESEFGFGVLHRLLLPFADDVAGLPDRQRATLESAFGLVDGPPADRFIVGLAALSVLASVARQRPVLCLVDDAQWLDRESLDALTFVARRLAADRIAMLFAVRGAPRASDTAFDGVAELPVDQLSEAEVRALLAAVSDDPIDSAVASRIVDATSGCPLAVIEFARAVSAEQLAGSGSMPDVLPISGRLERHFRAGVRALPPDTQLFLLIASVDKSGEPAVIWRAAAELGLRPDVADPAVGADLIRIGPAIDFRHPLIRSAVFTGASLIERRKVHRSLAAVADSDADDDRRAWHLAAAAAGPDEDVAAELERCGARAAQRGQYAAEAAFYERAAALTPTAERRAARLLLAAEAHVGGGSHEAATVALQDADADLVDPVARAHAERLRAALLTFTRPSEMAAVLIDAARALEPLDVRRARDTYAEAIECVLVSGHLTTGITPTEVAAAALGAPAPAETTIADLLMEGFATQFVHGFVAAAPLLWRAIEARALDPGPTAGLTRGANLEQTAAAQLWDIDRYGAMLRGVERIERERGALDTLRITLGGLGFYAMWTGQFAFAEACRLESEEISRALGDNAAVWRLFKVELLAWQGHEAPTRAAASILQSPPMVASGAGVAFNMAYLALATLELAQGHYHEAFESAWPLFDLDAPPYGTQSLPEIVEAGTRSGHLDEAHLAYDRLAERVAVSGTAWARGLLARTRALLADGDEADALYTEAIAQLRATVVKTDLARAHLLYGEWLRRNDRRADAGVQLAQAFDLFDAMGAQGFAERAQTELKATGVAATRQAVQTDLTGQEHQIAQLAADGATNNEIAATLFLSASTVDYHLRKVYRKLGISSRREILAAMTSRTST